MVKISMDTFVKRFQPDRYDLWVQGKDIGYHPEDFSRQCAAPPPTQKDVLVNKKYVFFNVQKHIYIYYYY